MQLVCFCLTAHHCSPSHTSSTGSRSAPQNIIGCSEVSLWYGGSWRLQVSLYERCDNLQKASLSVHIDTQSLVNSMVSLCRPTAQYRCFSRSAFHVSINVSFPVLQLLPRDTAWDSDLQPVLQHWASDIPNTPIIPACRIGQSEVHGTGLSAGLHQSHCVDWISDFAWRASKRHLADRGQSG